MFSGELSVVVILSHRTSRASISLTASHRQDGQEESFVSTGHTIPESHDGFEDGSSLAGHNADRILGADALR